MRLDDPAGFSGSLSDFSGAGDTLELIGQTVTDVQIDGTTMAVTLSAGAPLHFNLAGTLPQSVTWSGSDLTVASALPCLHIGTLIATPIYEVPVETLRKDDLVLGRRAGVQAIAWIGWRHVDCRRHPDPAKVWPVRVALGAFGLRQPNRPLWLSPNHAVWLDGVLIPIRLLANCSTIRQVAVDAISYYHIELPEHDLLLTEGLLMDSYLDCGDRANFTNGGKVLRLHPEFSPPPSGIGLNWEGRACAPVVVSGRMLAAARSLVAARANAARERSKGGRERT